MGWLFLLYLAHNSIKNGGFASFLRRVMKKYLFLLSVKSKIEYKLLSVKSINEQKLLSIKSKLN